MCYLIQARVNAVWLLDRLALAADKRWKNILMFYPVAAEQYKLLKNKGLLATWKGGKLNFHMLEANTTGHIYTNVSE